MRKWIIAIVFLLGFIFLVTRFAEMQHIAELIQSGDWRFFGLAFGVEIAWFAVVTLSYRLLFINFDIRETKRRLFQIVTAANFVTVVTPSGGMTGLAVFLSDARRRGHSLGRVTVACVFYLFSDYFAVLALAVSGLVFLGIQHRLNWAAIAAAAVILSLLIAIASLLLVGTRSTEKLGRLLARAARIINKVTRLVLRRNLFSEERAYKIAEDSAEGVLVLRQRPARFVLPGLLAASNKVLMMFILLLMFFAFRVPVSPGVLVAGVGLGYLFAIVTPSPSTFGVVEGLLTLALVSVGVRVEPATVMTLGFRAITFWIPFFVGLWSFRQISLPVPKLPAKKPATADATTSPSKASD